MNDDRGFRALMRAMRAAFHVMAFDDYETPVQETYNLLEREGYTIVPLRLIAERDAGLALYEAVGELPLGALESEPGPYRFVSVQDLVVVRDAALAFKEVLDA